MRLINKHGFDVLRTTLNKKCSKCEKERIINRFLGKNESFLSVTIDEEGIFQIEKNFCKCYLANTCHTLKQRQKRNIRIFIKTSTIL